MKILIIHNYANTVHISKNTYNIQELGIARALVKKGHQCDLVFWHTENETLDYVFDGDKHIQVFYRTGKNILKNAIFDRLDDLIPQYDIIQISEYNQLQAWKLAKDYPEKTIIYHGPYYSAFNKKYNILCKAFDLTLKRSYIKWNTPFLVKSNLAHDFLVNKGIQNVQTVGVGIDADALTVNVDEYPSFIENLPSKNGILNLLYIGTLEERRNIPFLFRVLKGLKENNVPARLVMVGKGNPEYVAFCWQEAEKLGVKQDIIYTEKMEQRYLQNLYKKCEFFLLPTHYEIFGMVLLEAMYYGLDVVTTPNGGSDMLIQNGVNGHILPLNENDWIETIIHDTQNIRTKIGVAAREKITSEFTWDALINKFESAYQNLLKRT